MVDQDLSINIRRTFYEPTRAETALKRYLEGLQTLYSRQKNQAVIRLLKGEQFKGKKVLEVGCGGGFWTAYFLSQGATVVSCDLRQHLVDAAKLYIANEGLDGERVTFVCSDIMDFQPTEKFDFVFAKDVLVHIEDDQKFLSKMYNIMVPTGKCYVSTQNALSLNYLVEGLMIQRLRGNNKWMGWDPTHVRFDTPFGFEKKIRKAGFKITGRCSVYHIPYRVLSSIPTRLLTGERRVFEHPLFHFLERWGAYFPFNKTGWYLGAIAEKQR